MATPASDAKRIVLLADGLENCGGDPCAVARELKAVVVARELRPVVVARELKPVVVARQLQPVAVLAKKESDVGVGWSEPTH